MSSTLAVCSVRQWLCRCVLTADSLKSDSRKHSSNMVFGKTMALAKKRHEETPGTSVVKRNESVAGGSLRNTIHL